MRHPGKEIFCRFRISNQILRSIYGSRDIERSLDTTLAVFVENLNFVDEYLENRSFFKCGVFCKCFVLIPSTILELFIEIVRAVSEKIAKNYDFDNIFAFFADSAFFGKSGRVTLFPLLTSNTVQKIRKIVRAIFEKNRQSINQLLLLRGRSYRTLSD